MKHSHDVYLLRTLLYTSYVNNVHTMFIGFVPDLQIDVLALPCVFAIVIFMLASLIDHALLNIYM
jgi:hypothetical protein